jgi:hypothetical protein
MFATTRFVAVMTEIFLRLIESGNSLLVIRGTADLSMEKNTEFGRDVKWTDGRMEGCKDARMQGWKSGPKTVSEHRPAVIFVRFGNGWRGVACDALVIEAEHCRTS